MSPRSQKHVLVFNPNVYCLYFRRLAETLGATGINVHQGMTHLIRLLANFGNYDSGPIHIEIVLEWSQNGTCWILREMNVTPIHSDILDPSEEFLPFRALRLANKLDDLYYPGDEIYRIRSASDLAALFKAYDELAHDWGKIPLFGH